MANPTYGIQGVTNIHPLNILTGFTATGGTATIEHGGLALNADAVSPAIATFRFPLPNAPVDGNGNLFVIRLYNNTNQFVNDGIVRFLDSAGNKAEVTPLDSWRRGELLYRIHLPSVSGLVEDPGFDIFDLADIEFVVDVSDIDETDVYVLRRLDYYDFSPMVLTGGSTGDPFTLDTILETLNQEFWQYDYSAEELWAKTYPQQAGPLLEPDAPIQIGDGVSGSTVFELGTLQGFSHRNEKQDRTSFRGNTAAHDYAEVLGDLPAAGQKLIMNLGDPKTYSPAVIYETEFIDLSPAEVTYNSWLFLRSAVRFGDHSALSSCSVIDSDAAITGGKSFIDSAIVNSTASIAIEWNGVVTFTNCRINCPGADYGINFDGSSFNDGDTFDASTLTFVADPLVKKFRLDAAGKTLNFNAGTQNYTAADFEIVDGTLNVVANQTTLTFTGIPSGTNASIRQGTKIIAFGNNIQSGNFSYSYTYTAGELIVYKFTNPGLVTIEESLELSALNQSIPLIFVSEESYGA